VLVVKFADATNPVQGILVADMTTQGIGRIRGVNHHPTIANDVYRITDQARLGIVRMNLVKLAQNLSRYY